MAYTVKELAELSGVSVRTLHFYDGIELLKPAYVGENGYRYYENEQLLMLQQILFFRELGFQLVDLQRVIKSDDFNKVQALKSHRQILEKNAEHTQNLLKTIDKTIASLEGGTEMKAKEIYVGFDKKKQQEYEKYWRDNGGDVGKKLLEESKTNTKSWNQSAYKKVDVEFAELDSSLTKAINNKFPATSSEVQKIILQHYTLISQFYRPTYDSYVGLGQMYVHHSDFKKRYDACHPKLAEFWAESMKVFAKNELT